VLTAVESLVCCVACKCESGGLERRREMKRRKRRREEEEEEKVRGGSLNVQIWREIG